MFERRSQKSTSLAICSETPAQLQSDECVRVVSPTISNKVSIDGFMVEMLCSGDFVTKISGGTLGSSHEQEQTERERRFQLK